MKISELQKEVKKKALTNQRNEISIWFSKSTDNLQDAFSWSESEEGEVYWAEWHEKKSVKPSQYSIGIDTFERMEANCNTEEILAFCKGNIDKYNWRKKGSDLEDFKKIIDYANFAIKQLNGKTISPSTDK